MYTKPPRSHRAKRGFTLVELMVASALGLVATAAVMTMWAFTSRSFAAAVNYTDLALSSRKTLDLMSRSIRQARQVTAFSTNSISLLDANGNKFKYTFNATNRTLVSVINGQATTNLTQCDNLQFWIFQRTPISNTFECYNPAFVTNAKLVQVTWSCSRTILGAKMNTEAIESAKITLRNH